MSRSSRSRSRARPASVVPSGTSGAGASSATAGSQSKSVRMRSTTVSSRMRFSASSTSRRCWRSRGPASCRSSSARSLRSASSWPPAALAGSGLAPALLAQAARAPRRCPLVRPQPLRRPRTYATLLGRRARCGSARRWPSPRGRGRGGPRRRRAGGSGRRRRSSSVAARISSSPADADRGAARQVGRARLALLLASWTRLRTVTRARPRSARAPPRRDAALRLGLFERGRAGDARPPARRRGARARRHRSGRPSRVMTVRSGFVDREVDRGAPVAVGEHDAARGAGRASPADRAAVQRTHDGERARAGGGERRRRSVDRGVASGRARGAAPARRPPASRSTASWAACRRRRRSRASRRRARRRPRPRRRLRSRGGRRGCPAIPSMPSSESTCRPRRAHESSACASASARGLPAAGVVLALAPGAARPPASVGLQRRRASPSCSSRRGRRRASSATSSSTLGSRSVASRSTAASSRAQRAGVGDERLDDTFVGRGGELALEAAALLGEQRLQPTRALAHRLDPHERVGDVAVAGVGQRAARRRAPRCRARAAGPGRPPRCGPARAVLAQPLGLGLQPGELVADEVEADRPQLVDEPVVAAGGVGLLLQRREAAAGPRGGGRSGGGGCPRSPRAGARRARGACGT